MAKKAALVEEAQGGAPTAFTDEQIAYIKATLLKKTPTVVDHPGQVLAEPDMCSMTYGMEICCRMTSASNKRAHLNGLTYVFRVTNLSATAGAIRQLQFRRVRQL
ncbi:hypothetical protein [Bradyrhizobium sp. USDA 4473]